MILKLYQYGPVWSRNSCAGPWPSVGWHQTDIAPLPLLWSLWPLVFLRLSFPLLIPSPPVLMPRSPQTLGCSCMFQDPSQPAARNAQALCASLTILTKARDSTILIYLNANVEGFPKSLCT